jgi:hypothetical protein
MAEVARELLESYEKARETVKKHYPKALTAGLAGPAGEYEFRCFIKDFGRSVTGSLRCRDGFCESEVFVGWPPPGVREDFNAYARTYPQCRALHERLIESGSVLYCSESPVTGMDRLLDLIKLVTGRAEEMRRG